MMSAPGSDHDRWIDEVRDPATASRRKTDEGVRDGQRCARWELAPIPGGWAWRAHAETGGLSYSGTPWTGPVPTESEARASAIGFARRHFNQVEGADRILSKLDALDAPSLFDLEPTDSGVQS